MNIAQDFKRPVLTHVGGPTILIRYAGLNFLTDPTFDAPGQYPVGAGRTLDKLTGPAVAAEDLGRIDVVLLSHDQHADNLDNSGRVVLKDAEMVLSTGEAASRMPLVRGLRPWEPVTVAGDAPVVITAVPALHGPSGAELVTGEVTGFVLEADGWPTMYVSGDNASLELVAEISLRFPATAVAVAFAGAARTPLFGGAPLTLTSQGVVELARLFPLATVVPVHTEGWRHFTEGPDVVKQLMGDAGLAARLAVLPLGEPKQA
ncbi:MBL fold metallo-hydrolase [Arthrobacter sp. NPDC058127]|uniref:MBL fold metallo-hydrolase n=1 Tax=Arthrobacter sp. NPDC058127 TaxID=3346351 RepID=UPI0036EA252D